MTSLEMQCPGCEQVLELDAGFAGGVCRCSHCGTLMTVPTHPGSGPERLQRPEAPGQRPEAPTIAGEEAPAPAEDDTRNESPEDATSPTSGQASSEAASQIDTQTLTTDSGRTVQIGADAVIPTARRKNRPFVRLVTAAVILLVFAVLVGLSGYAIFLVAGGGDSQAPGDDAQAAVEQFGYDPTVNVYTLDEPNVLGLPLQSSSAVVVDASAASSRWLGLVQDAVRVGAAGKSESGEVGLIYATEPDVRTLADQMQPLSQITPEQVHEFQAQVRARGVAPLTPAIEQAIAWQPRQIILITGQEPDGNAIASIDQALRASNNVTLDVVTVGSDVPALKTLTERHGGQYVQLSQGQLLRWYQSADVPLP